MSDQLIVEPLSRPRPNYVLFASRFSGLIFLTLAMLGTFTLRSVWIRDPNKKEALRRKLTLRWAKWSNKIMGYRVNITGQLPNKGCLLAPNHVTYGDIVVLQSLAPCSFISKAEIAHYPLIGYCARLCKTVFISRRKERSLNTTSSTIAARLQEQNNVVVFLEATTSDGRNVLPFKSSLLQSVIEAKSPVVPITLKWSSEHKHTDPVEDIAFWRDDHTLMKHLVGHLGRKGKRVDIHIGEPIESANYTCRKTLANDIQQQLQQRLASSDA